MPFEHGIVLETKKAEQHTCNEVHALYIALSCKTDVSFQNTPELTNLLSYTYGSHHILLDHICLFWREVFRVSKLLIA